MQFLIDRGIDLTIKDCRWNGSAKGWALYALQDEKMAQWRGAKTKAIAMDCACTHGTARRTLLGIHVHENHTDDTARIAKVESMTACEEAERAGIDLSLIDVSLEYSYDKRAQQHQAALEFALELERVGHQLRGATEPADRTPL
jgi:hypothetical protein